MIENVSEKYKALRMKACGENLPEVIEMASQKNWSALSVIDHLLDLELESRRQNRVAQRFKQSKLNEKPTIDQFDFNFHISRKNQKSKILNLLSLDFIKQKQDIIFIGNTGVGKTFLAKCIAYAATLSGIKTLFTSTMDMINHLTAAEADHSLLKKLQYYQSFDLLVCDEIGFLPLGIQGSNLFFQAISQGHKTRSTIITTNLTFAHWGNIFDSTTLAAVIADRLVYNSEIIVLEGPSYRKRLKH